MRPLICISIETFADWREREKKERIATWVSARDKWSVSLCKKLGVFIGIIDIIDTATNSFSLLRLMTQVTTPKRLLKNISVQPELSIKASDASEKTHVVSGYSSYNSTYDEELTPRSTTQAGSTLTDSESDSLQPFDSRSTTDSSGEIRRQMPSASSQTRITVKPDNHAVAVGKSTSQLHKKKVSMATSTRKRDKIRSVLNRSKSSTSTDGDENDVDQWGEMLAKTLVSMHQDVTEIIAGFDRLEQLPPEDAHSDAEAPILTNPRLSFHERQSAKTEMVRMATMLHPPNLLTCTLKQSPYAYADIVEPHGFQLLKMFKQLPGEHLLVQHKPLQHRKLRYRSQRGLLGLQRDLRKLKRDLFGKISRRTQKELPSLYVQNYRNRLEKTLLDVRRQITEYDQIHAHSDHRHQSISQVIAKMGPSDPVMQACMEDYRVKSRPIVRFDCLRKNSFDHCRE